MIGPLGVPLLPLMHTHLTTRRALVLEAHVVAICALLFALARLPHRSCRQFRTVAGLACIRRVSPRKNTDSQRTRTHAAAAREQTHYTHSPADVYIRNTIYAIKHTHDLGLTHMCARTHMHTHTGRQTVSHACKASL